MKFTINSKSLLSALNLTAKGINTNNVVPATSCYRLHKVGDQLQIETCSLEISMQTSLPCEIADDLDILIPAEKVTRLLASLPDQPLIFEITDLDITIKAASGEYALSGYSAEDYPVINTETDFEATVSADDLAEAIYITEYARGVDKLQPKFTGLNIVAEKNKLIFAGCSHHRLSIFNLPGKFKAINIVLAPGIVTALLGLQMQGDCKICYSEKSISFQYDNLILKSMLMDEIYPDYMGVIPVNETKISVDRNALISAIKRVLEFTNKEQKIILSSNTELLISGQDEAYKQSASERLTLINAAEIKIGLNGSYLLAAASHFSSDVIDIYWQSEAKAILLKQPGDDINFSLIMPMVI